MDTLLSYLLSIILTAHASTVMKPEKILQLVRFSTDMVTYLSIGKALFQAVSSRGADCLIICFCRSGKVAKKMKIPRIYDWLMALIGDADILFGDDFLQPSSSAVGELFQFHLQISGHRCIKINPSETFNTGEE